MRSATHTRIVAPRKIDLRGLNQLRTGWPIGRQIIDLRLNTVQAFEPVGIAGLACLIGETRRAGGDVICNTAESSVAGSWVTTGIFEVLGFLPPRSSDLLASINDPPATIVQVRSEDDIASATSNVVNLIPGKSEIHRIMGQIVSELSQNISQHSGAEGYISAEYLSSTSAINFCIADYGCGLMSSLTAKYNPQDDISAIELALKAGVSSRRVSLAPRQERNRGVGLTCAYRLTIDNGGVFEIWSGAGLLNHVRGLTSPPRRMPDSRWGGTLLSCLVPCDQAKVGFTDVLEAVRIELDAAESTAPSRRFDRRGRR